MVGDDQEFTCYMRLMDTLHKRKKGLVYGKDLLRSYGVSSPMIFMLTSKVSPNCVSALSSTVRVKTAVTFSPEANTVPPLSHVKYATVVALVGVALQLSGVMLKFKLRLPASFLT